MKYYCPKCKVIMLEYDNNIRKFKCPRCGFLDRRQGSSYIDPKMDRRGTYAQPYKECPWDSEKDWEKSKPIEFSMID